jgi:hypothetical protein
MSLPEFVPENVVTIGLGRTRANSRASSAVGAGIAELTDFKELTWDKHGFIPMA